MRKVKYLKQFRSILADLRLEVAKGKMAEYEYYTLNSYLVEVHRLMCEHGKRLVFKAMYLMIVANTGIRSKYEVYAYKLVAEKFKKYKVLKIMRRWLDESKNNF